METKSKIWYKCYIKRVIAQHETVDMGIGHRNSHSENYDRFANKSKKLIE